MKKKILSLFLALAMCLSLLPTAAFAADGAQDPAEPGEEILAPEQLEDPEKDPDPEQEGGPAGVSAPQTGAANSEIAVQATGGHSQYHTRICNEYGCTEHRTLTWSTISTVDQLTSATGETKGYYLTTDLELTEPWAPTGTVNLCLSGHSITLRAGTEAAPQSVITVNSGVQLNISNCIAIKPDSTSEGIYYGGPYVRHAEHAVGPGITVSNGGTVELFGGNITQNSDGVVVENGGTLNMPSNSEVSGNTGAGVRVENGGTLNISGGKIGSNEGCGVDVAQGSTFNVSGGTEILRNTKNGETCNVYLHDSATVKVSKLSQAKIGVTVETPPTDGNFVPVTSDNQASRSDQNCITSDNAAYRVFYSTSKSAGNLVLGARPTPLHADHDSKMFVNSLSSSGGALLINGEDAELDSYGGTSYYTLPEGNYYLEGDLELDKGLLAYSTNVVLCLNGHNITVTGTSYVIYTAKKTSSGSYTFTLTDCADEPGTLTHSYNQYANGGVCVRDGTFIMRGGKISGNNSGVYVYQGNEFKIYGGEISGNKSYGVSLTPVSGALSGNGKIYMTVGGTAKIKDNWADGAYNAVTGLYEQGTTGTAKNVLFTDKPFKYITVDSTLTEGAEIGVTIWKVVTAERDCVAVATYGTANTADATPYVQYFKSDSADYKVWSRDNNVVIGVWNSEDQIHPVCGAVCSHKDTDGKPLHKDIVWTPVSSESGLNNNGDNIYLTDDITLTRTWQISAGGTVNLCLNGHTIKANGDFDAITLKGNTNTLNICDCSKSCSGKITHGTKEDHTTYSGAGVYMTAAGGRKATVNMYGGTITGNTGHKVEIKGTTSTCGGGVYVDSNAQFFMRGGSITGNTAAQGGGVYYTVSTSLFVSGNVNIMGNKDTDDNNNNVYVPSSYGTPPTVPFYIGGDGLAEEAKIGVRVNDGVIGTGEHSPVAQFAPQTNMTSAYHKGNFSADNGGVYGFKMEAREHDTLTSTHVVNLYNGLPHQHPICGETCTDGAHTENLSWTGVSSLDEITGAGNYYLTQDVEITGGWGVKNIAVNLCLNGHSITRKYDDTWKGAVITISGDNAYDKFGKLTLCDCNGSGKGNGQITHEENADGVGVQLQYVSAFDMYGGRITGNNNYGVNVGGSAAFHMYGGSINNNKGGVYGSGTITVSGDVHITDNNGTNVNLFSGKPIMVSGALGGNAEIGVTTEIPDGSYVTVAKGTDTSPLKEADLNRFEQDNTSYGKKFVDGSVIFYNGTLHEHAVCGTKSCTDTGHSDQVWLPLTYDTEDNWLRSGGKSLSRSEDGHILPAGNYYLYENITTDRPIMIYGDVNLCLNGHTISTTAALAGNGKALIKNDGHSLTICDCSEQGKGEIKAPSGAMNGILTTGALTMYGGTITGGAQYGVYVTTFSSSSTGTFQMYGGTITGNGTGVGRYENANTLTFGGDAKVKDNTSINVSLLNTGTITIDASLTKDAKIGVYFTKVPADTETKQFATGATGSLDYANIFSCDNGSDYVLTKDTSGNLYFGKHQHVWSYTAEGATITATCTADGCNLTGNSGGRVTIVAPDESTLTYDGNPKEATLEGALTTGVTLTAKDIKYYHKIGEQEYLLETGAKPTNAKSYRAEITVGGVNASVDYEIKKATPTADDFTFTPPTSLTYDGSPKTATVTSTKIDASYVTVKYYQDGTEVSVPTNAGTYTVKIDVTESGNYFAASGLNANDWMFAIAKNTTTPTMTLDQYYSLTYKKSQLTPPVTVTINGKSLTENVDYTVTYGKNIDAGELAGSVTINPMGNYEFRQIVRSFTIDARYIAVTASDKTSRVGQNLVALTYTCTKGLPYEGDTFTGELATNANKNTAGTYQITQGTLSLGNNYNIAFTPGTYTVEDKQPQTGFKFENAAVAKTYGNTDFTVTATDQVDGSSVTYSSSNEAVATVDSTGKVTIVGAGTAKIIATASATDDYAEATAEYTLTVSPKTLTAADLEFTANSTFTKEYDGTTNCTTATVQIKSAAKVNQNDVLPTVTGTYAYNSKDAKGATKVTFTTERTENTNYILPAGLTVEHKASITQRVLTVGEVTTMSKQYDRYANATFYVTGIELIGTVSGETLKMDATGAPGDYGIFDTKFDSADAGKNKRITGTVTLLGSSALASNYTFEVDGKESSTAPFTATGEIIPADGGSKGSVEHTQKFTDGDPKTETIAWQQLLPAGQTWNYGSEYYSASSVTVDHGTDDNGALTYTITGGKEDDVVVFTVSAKCNNYQDFMYTVRVTLTARDPQKLEFKGVENGKVTKTYGDQPFTEPLTGAETTVTYTSSDENVAKVNAQTGEVTIVGAGTAEITAAAAETDVYASASASYALTVNKLRIPVPTKGTNELEYTGQEQTYLPDGLDTAYCEIESNTATDVIAGGSWHNADVSLKDRSNTEWADGADSTAHRPYPFRITPKPVTVTALDKKITAGQPAPELTSADYTVTGLIGNDTLGGISLYYADPSDLRTAVTPDTGKAGTYAIVVTKGGTGSNNYAPTFVNGTLTIASRPSGGVVAVTYPVNVPGETERGSVSSNVKNASKGSTVTITVEPEDGFQLADLTVTDKDGNELPLTDKGDGKYTFTMPAGKVEVNATFAEKIETSPFADVSTDAYYYEAVKWAAEQGITGGVGGGLFAPDQSCTRAQIVTFLWRAAGSPEPKSMSSFSDVPEDSYYAKAVAWAVENGITVGTSATTFSPDATCTRAQGVTFLFRAAKASADGAPAFRDVAADAYYAAAVKWATDNSVTNGIGGGLFGSDNDCTRAQIVTFLWRLYAGK